MNPIKTNTQAILAGLLAFAIFVVCSLLSSCSTIRPIEPTELETEATFNYSQTFQAKLVANGVGDNYDEILRKDKVVHSITTKLITFSKTDSLTLFEDGGNGCISWHSDKYNVYTVNGKVSTVTVFKDSAWIKYWAN